MCVMRDVVGKQVSKGMHGTLKTMEDNSIFVLPRYL